MRRELASGQMISSGRLEGGETAQLPLLRVELMKSIIKKLTMTASCFDLSFGVVYTDIC